MNAVVWQPKHPEKSQMWQFMQYVAKRHQQTLHDYHQLHAWSVAEPAQFWQALVDFFHISFHTPATTVLAPDTEMLEASWFPGATLNYAAWLLRQQDENTALVSINEQNQRRTLSYRELKKQVELCAAGLHALGVRTGDRVVAVMPNVDYTVIACLATAFLGAIWSSCSTDFGADATIERLGQVDPCILFVSDGHEYQGKAHEDLTKAAEIAAQIPSLKRVIVCPIQHPNPDFGHIPKAQSWSELINSKHPTVTPAFVPFDHPIYILFSSGTTGKPKCIVHRTGGVLLQHIKELALHTDIHSNDNLLFYTTCGWMMWNWMISVLALGATLTIYEGSPTYPDSNRLFRLINEEHVSVFGTSAKFISSVEKSGVIPKQHYPMTSLRCILSTGSPLLPQNYDFVYEKIKPDVQLSSISGGTDLVSCFALGNPMLPVYRGELQSLGLGMAVAVFDEQGHAIQQARGELVCTKPFPSMPLAFWHDPEKQRYRAAYFSRFPGCWAHGDFAELTAQGGLIIYGRSDTVLNPGGVRIGTAEIYRQVEKIPEILDSIVIAQKWHHDERIVLFVKLKSGLLLTEPLLSNIRQMIRNHASPRHVPDKIIQVADIPRTINGKTVELAVKQIVHGQPVQNIQSLANPEALQYFANREELLN